MTPVRRFLTTARRVWWLFVVCAVVGVALSAGLSALKSKSYSASTQVLITAGDGGILSANSNSDPALNVADAQLIAQSAAFYQKAASQLAVRYEDLEGDVTVTNPTNTDALDFSVSAGSPDKAIEYANVVGGTFSSYYTSFVEKAGSLPQGRRAAVVVSTAVRATKTGSSLVRDLIVGIVAGLIIALLGVGLIESRDQVIRTPADIDDSLRLRTIYLPAAKVPGRIESLRQLTRQVSIRNNPVGSTPVTILSAGFTSEAAQFVAALLAESLRSEGHRTHVSDLDGRFIPAEGGPGIELATTNMAELSSMIGELIGQVRLWLVIVQLGRSTEADLDQVRLLFAGAGIDQKQVVGVALSRAALLLQ